MSPLTERLPGCTLACRGGIHSPQAHEAYGRRRAYADLRVAFVRRTGIVRTGHVEVDFDRCEVRRDGVSIGTTVTEYKLLALLATRLGCVVPHALILTDIWGIETRTPRRSSDFRDTEEGHLIRVNVSRCRNKLGPSRGLLENVRDRGYLLRAEPAV